MSSWMTLLPSFIFPSVQNGLALGFLFMSFFVCFPFLLKTSQIIHERSSRKHLLSEAIDLNIFLRIQTNKSKNKILN